MKIISTFIVIFSLLALSSSCKKGDQGDPGTPGTPGLNGNANVVQYNLGEANFITSYKTFSIPTTQDTTENSLWYVYLYFQSIGRWYNIPGAGVSGATQYRVSVGYLAPNAQIFVDKNGPGEIYSKVRIIRVYASRNSPGGSISMVPRHRQAGIDASDYTAMQRFYQLPSN